MMTLVKSLVGGLVGGLMFIRGGVFFVVFLVGYLFGQVPPSISPIPEPSDDEIARALEAERLRRESELNNPITQIAIQRAQQIQSLLGDVNLKSQEYRIQIENNIDRAAKAITPELAAGFYEEIIRIDYAFRIYTEQKLAGIVDDESNPQRVQAFALLDDIMVPAKNAYVKNRIALAEAAQQRYEFDEAKQIIEMAAVILPDDDSLKAFKRSNEIAEAKFRRMSPGMDVGVRLKELEERRRQVQVLLRDGKFLWEARDFAQAEDKFNRAVKLDPRNDIAYNYLRLIGRVRNDDAELAREVNFRNMIQEVNDKWRPPAHQESLPVPNPEWMQRTRGGAGAPGGIGGIGANTGVIQKLQSIRIPEMAPLDGFSLNEVVSLLDEAARQNDHSETGDGIKGVNMMVSTRLPEKKMSVNVGGVGNMGFVGSGFGPPQINFDNGLPIRNRIAPGAASMSTQFPDSRASSNQRGQNTEERLAANKLDPNKIRVRGLTAPLRNLTLQQLLDNVADACDFPMRNVVRNGVVVFEYKPADSDFVQRKFSIKPNTFWQRLATTRRNLDPINTQDGTLGLNKFEDRQGGSGGGELGGSSSGGGGPGGGGITNTQAAQQIEQYLQAQGINTAQVFFNPGNGQLLVRAPLADLDLIEEAIAILNTSPEQLYIEAKFAEIEFDDSEALGFDWYLGNSTLMGDKVVSGAGPHPTFIGKPTSNNPSGFFPYPGVLQGNTFTPSPYSIAPNPDEGRLTAGFKGYGNPLWTFTGIMTDPQFRMVINAISQQEGAEILSAPRILAISGEQASISVVDQRTIVQGVVPQFTPGQAFGSGGGTVTPILGQIPTGPQLDVLPYVNTDGYTIEMNVAPQITEFLGYETAEFEAATISGGQIVTSPTPLPRTRQRNLNVNCVVWDQTILALGGLISEGVQTTRDKVPFLGDAPFVGRLFRGTGRKSKKKNMVIYVKPTIIDPAGNQKNRPSQLPFSRTDSPPNMGLIEPNTGP